MEEKMLYPIEVLVGRSSSERDQFQIFEPTIHWRGDSEREVALSRLGKILRLIKLPLSVEIVLGRREVSLWIVLEKVGSQTISSNKGEYVMQLFGGAYSKFLKVFDSEVKEDFVFRLREACKRCGCYFADNSKDLHRQAKEEMSKAVVLKKLKVHLSVRMKESYS